MHSIRCGADLARVLDGGLDPRLRSILTDYNLKPGERLVVVRPRDTLAAVTTELGAAIVAHLMKSRAARRAEAHLHVLSVQLHRGGWLQATFVGGVSLFIQDRIYSPPELLIPLLAH